MAQQVHRVVADRNARPFDIRALRRLAIWGAAAAAALSVAVLAGYANPAAQRLLGTMSAAIGRTQHRVEASPAQTATRVVEADNETRRLAEAVRALAADRNELLTRISSLEQSLEDITGSINRQAASASPPPPASATDASLLFSPPVTPPAAMETVNPLPSPPPGPVSAVPEELPPSSDRIATLPAIGGSAEAELSTPKIESTIELRPEFGVDIGGAVNFDALRVLWNSTRAGHAALLDGLAPRVAVRENGKSQAAELRLIVGPLPDAEAAARLCTTLLAARRSCQPTPFVGEHFALTSPQPERKPAPAAERKPAPQPARQPVRPNP